MTIEQADIIDGLGINKVSGSPELTISDHLEWDARHFSLLETKLAAYIHFIESGQLSAHFPGTDAKRPVIDLICQYRPTAEAEVFLAAAAKATLARGVVFQHGPLPTEGYYGEG